MPISTKLVRITYGPGRPVEFIDAHLHEYHLSINENYSCVIKSRIMPIHGNIAEDVGFFARNHGAKEEFNDAVFDHIGITLFFGNFDSGKAIPFQRTAMPDQNFIEIVSRALIETLRVADIAPLKPPVQSTDFPEDDYFSVKSYTRLTLRTAEHYSFLSRIPRHLPHQRRSGNG